MLWLTEKEDSYEPFVMYETDTKQPDPQSEEAKPGAATKKPFTQCP